MIHHTTHLFGKEGIHFILRAHNITAFLLLLLFLSRSCCFGFGCGVRLLFFLSLAPFLLFETLALLQSFLVILNLLLRLHSLILEELVHNCALENRIAKDTASARKLASREGRVALVYGFYFDGLALVALVTVCGYVASTWQTTDAEVTLAIVALDAPTLFRVLDAELTMETVDAEVDCETIIEATRYLGCQQELFVGVRVLSDSHDRH